MGHGSVYRRCRDESTGRLLGRCCPGLRSPEHGSWYFSAELPSPSGERRRVRKGGFAAREAAAVALGALVSPVAPEPGLATGEWPVLCCHRCVRAGVHTCGLGRAALGSSGHRPGLDAISSARTAPFSAARSVAWMRCSVAALTGCAPGRSRRGRRR